MIEPAVAMQDQVGDLMLFEQVGDESAPILEPAAVMRCRQSPEQLVAEMQVDPMHAVPARDQCPAELVEEVRDRPLQEEKGAFAAESAPVALLAPVGHCRRIGIHGCGGLDGIESGDAVPGAPALAAETHRLEQI